MNLPTSLLAAVATVAGLVGAAGTTSATATSMHLATSAHSAGRNGHATIKWGSCQKFFTVDSNTGNGIRCASLKVPMNYAHPHGKQISLAVSEIRHTSSAKHYQGVMLSNPGGPGGDGLSLGSFLSSSLPHGVGADYDWVSFDPRGVGESRPAISCDNGYFKGPRRPYRPSSPAILHYWLRRSKAYADTCERKYPELLNNMTTVDSVRDMESIRKAVGVNKISFYGYSYGTYLGEVYSTLHPTHLRRMVLDSNVDPRRIWYQANLDQDKAFQRVINRYFAWVASYDDVYGLGATKAAVMHRYDATIKALAAHPKGMLGPDEWEDAFENAAYLQADWPDVTSAWHEYVAKNKISPMTHQYKDGDDVGSDNEYAVYNAVQCTDTRWPQSWQRWKRDNTTSNKKYPFLTWSNAWYNAPCLYWGGKASKPVTINGKHTRSALLIDETLDPATPYPGSLEVRKLYPHSSLIAEPGGTSHANSLAGDACVDNQIARYLATGHRPARKPGSHADATCAPLPTPHPDTDTPFARPFSF